MRYKNKKVLVYGLGKSGLAVLKCLLGAGAKIFLYDDDKERLDEVARRYGVSTEVDIASLDMVVVSPSIPKDNPLIASARAHKVKVVGEMEFGFCENPKARYVAITGTNGKTTTVNIIDSILKEAGRDSLLLGNVGTPLSSAVCGRKTVVLEVSSFQLEFIDRFRPQISVILNLAPDHLDRYESEEEYYTYKKKIVQNIKNDYLVLNRDDDRLAEFAPPKAEIYHISLREFDGRGAFVLGDAIYYSDKTRERICALSDLHLIGIHNLYNIMASIVVARLLGIDADTIARAVTRFAGVPHRFEFVCEHDGVIVIDDSKATNVASTLSAYRSIRDGSHIILGGSSKGEAFDKLFETHPRYRFYIAGDTAEEIFASATRCGMADRCAIYDNIFEATADALAHAKSGEMVVLTPACASFDAFRDFEDRGEQYKAFVRSHYEI